MSLFPAANFSSFDGSRNARLAQTSALQSPLYILHRDWTKPILRPFTIQSILNGETANNQFSVNLGVPAGATHVGLHWVMQYTMSTTTDSVSSSAARLGTGGMTAYVLRLFGRIPTIEPSLAYGPAEAGLASAVAVDNTVGYWRPLLNIALTINSSLALFDLATSSQTYGINYRVSANKRLVISPFNIAGLINLMTHSYNQQPMQSASTTITANAADASTGLVPLKGSDRLLLIAEHFGTAEAVTFTNTATGGTVTATDFSAIGATFHA